MAPPITVVFLFGVFWRRASSQAAFTTLWTGSLAGCAVFLVEWFKQNDWLRQYVEWDVPMMLASFYLFLLCSAIMLVASLAYPHAHTAESEKLVWSNPAEALRGVAWQGIGNYRRLSVLLFVTMIALYSLFQWQPWRP